MPAFKNQSTVQISELFYGDQVLPWPDRPLAADATSDRKALIKRLNRQPFTVYYKGSEALAEKLEPCEEGDRCGSQSCPDCARATQNWFVAYLWVFSEVYLRKYRKRPHVPMVLAATVIPSSLTIHPSELNSQDSKQKMRLAKQQLRACLDSLDIQHAVFAFDFSFNDQCQRGGEIFWQPHFHGLIFSDSRKISRKQIYGRLIAAFPGSDTVKKPIRIRKFTVSTKGLSYLLKPKFWGRRSYLSINNNKRKPFWNTRGFRLRAGANIEISLLMDFLNFSRRVLWHRVNCPKIEFSKKGDNSPENRS